LEAEIVIFPLEAGAAASSRESSCPESATLIVLAAGVVVVVVLFVLVTLLAANVETPLWDADWRALWVGAVTLLEDATFVPDELWSFVVLALATFVLDELWSFVVLELVVRVFDEVDEGGESSNDGGGEELVVAPAPAKVPVVLPFPP
jgi:hypothetical protein